MLIDFFKDVLYAALTYVVMNNLPFVDILQLKHQLMLKTLLE